MKCKKLVSIIAMATLIVGCGITASAESLDWDLSSSQELNRGWFIGRYDTGSVAPYDDVCAMSQVSVAIGMGGYAYASLTALNGEFSWTEATDVYNGWVTTDWGAAVSGQDYASQVHFNCNRSLANGEREGFDDWVE